MNTHGILTEHSLSTHHWKGREGKGTGKGREGNEWSPFTTSSLSEAREPRDGVVKP